SPGARGRQKGLNENFAREVMELHTLGADGGYTQEDVITLARVLTGWSINAPDARVYPEYAAVFEGSRHDYSPKVFLGHTLKASGKAEGEEARSGATAGPPPRRGPAISVSSWRNILSPMSRLRRWSTGSRRVFCKPMAIFGRF